METMGAALLSEPARIDRWRFPCSFCCYRDYDAETSSLKTTSTASKSVSMVCSAFRFPEARTQRAFAFPAGLCFGGYGQFRSADQLFLSQGHPH